MQFALPSHGRILEALKPVRAVKQIRCFTHYALRKLPRNLLRLQVIVRVEELNPLAARIPQNLVPRMISAAMVAANQPHALRSEEHTSELLSHSDLVCRLL